MSTRPQLAISGRWGSVLDRSLESHMTSVPRGLGCRKWRMARLPRASCSLYCHRQPEGWYSVRMRSSFSQ